MASAPSLSKEDWKYINDAIKVFIEDGLFEPEYRDPAVILLTALVVGANADTVATATGLNRDKVVRPIGKLLRASGVWKNGVTYCQWFDDDWKVGNISFLCDVMCAAGQIVRIPEDDADDGTPHTRTDQETP